MNPTPDDDCNPIERIAAEFADRLRQGEHPTVEEYATRHPEFAGDIVELLPGVVAMEQLKVHKEADAKSRFLKGPRPLKKLGDYLILGEIGRGGMGIVYEAEQQSLGRRVAVKVLPRQSLLDERRLDRFEREAQTAARLHHTNIVPIFGVGEQDGYHYYVMQFIHGLGLDRVIRELRGEQVKRTPGGSSTISVQAMARDAASGLRDGRFRLGAGPGERKPASGVAGPDDGTGSGSGTGPESGSGPGIGPDPGTDSGPDSGPDSGSDAGAGAGPASAAASTAASDRQRPRTTYWHSIARVGLQVADALSYAHSQGTLHRDIKPANLLLDTHGIVWVTDFGLAKAIEDDHLTQSGDVVGTLQYMAPEQFAGSYDARSDIYCLGLTLYELLTLQPAYPGSNRSGLIHRVTEGRPAPPRKVRAGIPGELETIVLKAISREPQHRYQNAAAMREDLQRYLEDRPILARRASPAQHVWRWCRRNRALAAAVLIALCTLLGATALGWANYGYQTRINKDLGRAKQLVQDNLSRSLRAFGEVFDHIAGPDMFQVVIRDTTEQTTQDGDTEHVQSVFTPDVSERDAAILQKILGVYEEFARENGDHPDLQQDTARANQKTGDIHMRLGKLTGAAEAYHRAIAIYQQLDEDAYAIPIATIRNQLGQVFAQRGLLDEARNSHTLVLAALADSAGEPRLDSDRAIYELARAHDYLGSWGVLTEAERRGARGARGGRGAGRRADRSGADRRGAGRTGDDRRSDGRRSRPTGRDRESGDGRRRRGRFPWRPDPGAPRDYSNPDRRHHHHLRAQQLFAQLVARHPKQIAFRLGQARSCRNFYGYLWTSRPTARRDPADAFLAAYLLTDAVAILEGLVEEFPGIPLFRYELAETLVAARPVADYERPEIERGLEIARELHREFPGSPAYAALVGRVLSLLGSQPFRDPQQARAELTESLRMLEELVRESPEHEPYRRERADARRVLVTLLLRERDAAAARPFAEAMMRDEEPRLSRADAGPRDLFRLEQIYRLTARCLRGSGETAAAAAVDAKVEAIRARWRGR